MKQKKIAVLFKEDVRKINVNYTAGAERVFLQDVQFLKKLDILYKSYSAEK